MANSEYNYIPTYIRRTINNRPKDVVTASYWNELFNLLITQGDHTAEELGNILNYFSTRLVGVESEIAESAEAIANIREVFRINVAYSNSDRVYSADKTFAEIKEAYDAGQLPYVVENALSGFYDIYTLSHFWYDESSAHGFADFECYRILTGTLKTITLRIHSRTLESGSNIELRISEFNAPGGATYIAVDSTDDVISTVNGETYADIQALIDADKPVVVRFDDGLDFYYFETFRLSDSSGVHMRLNFRCVMGSIVYTLTLRDDNTWVFRETSLQTSSITDSGGYFTSDTVEGALQEIGAKLAQEQLSGTTSELTPTQVYNAVSAGIPVKVQYTDSTYGLLTFTAFNSAETLYTIVSQAIVYYNSAYILAELFGNRTTNTWGFVATTLAQKTDIPTALKNPNALTIKVEDTTVTYDGSAAMTVNIPSAVTDDHINSLIDTKLGVIENGSY